MTALSIVLGSDGILTVPQFRTLQSAFSDSSMYIDDAIEMYLTISASMLDPNRWLDWRPMGMSLMVAHWLSLDAREAATAAKGGIPGQGGIGIMTSKSVGQVSAGYDVQSGTEEGAGYWNMTTFGRRYIHMARLVGMGGTQITGNLTSPRSNQFSGPVF